MTERNKFKMNNNKNKGNKCNAQEEKLKAVKWRIDKK